MQYSSTIYAMFLLFGRKTLTHLLMNKSLRITFRIKIPIQILYLKNPKFLTLLIKQPWKTAFLLANI